ncbi:MAG: cell division protein FtsL [Gammaproteobacteria bacterium]|nr:cell division protein FtsL [Gammaproteobacteria bacterium]MDH3466104.1 cell division protein FtsL [Gammaproteobacteria bacterium]MDH3639796.1 cell division protein FtsL [Gammaproteobacteria bacterium]
MRSVVVVMALLLVVSATFVVHVRHKNRLAFLELQGLQKQRDRLNVEWGQLLLEQATWSVHHLVEKKARTELEMVNPDQTQIVTLALDAAGDAKGQ